MKNPITNITNGSLTRKGSKKSRSRRGLLAAPLLIAIIALAAVRPGVLRRTGPGADGDHPGQQLCEQDDATPEDIHR